MPALLQINEEGRTAENAFCSTPFVYERWNYYFRSFLPVCIMSSFSGSFS